MYGSSHVFLASLLLLDGEAMEDLPLAFSHKNPLSVSHILFDGVSQLSEEVQRILSNQCQSQNLVARATCLFYDVCWGYIKNKVDVPVHQTHLVWSQTIPGGRDMAISKVKKRLQEELLQIHDVLTLQQLIGMLGISAVIGIQNHPP